MRIHTTLRTSVLILLSAALAGCGDDDLTVAVADDVAGASMGIAQAEPASESPSASGAEEPVVEAPTAEIPTAETPIAVPPTGENGSGAETPEYTAPASALEAAAAEAAAKRAAAEAEAAIANGTMAGIGDLGNSDEQPALPPVEEPEAPPAGDADGGNAASEDVGSEVDDEGEDEREQNFPTPEEWKPPPVTEPKLEEGVWNVTFDYLGSFDTGMLALPEDSPLAIEARREQQMLAEKGAPTPTGLPPESDDIPVAPVSEIGFPDAVRAMDGQVVRIEGYMIPLKFDDGKVTSFFLSRYMMGCCFGVLPKANEIIEVVMEEGKGAFYDAYMPFVVKGKFVIVEEGTDPEYMQSVFRMTAESCEYSEDW